MKTDKNSYIYLFAIVMALVLAVLLSLSETLLKPFKEQHVRNEKMQNILKTIGVTVPADEASKNYSKFIKREIVLDSKGNILEGLKAFDINLKLETRKPVSDQQFPIYIAEQKGQYYYIIPLRGAGLWDAIWGYIALEGDFNTVQGVIFDHKSETPGLGAEITKDFFTNTFKEKKVFDDQGDFIGIEVAKAGKASHSKEHSVDAISGATITSEGVSAMIKERLSHYLSFIRRVQEAKAITPSHQDIFGIK